jgi:phosphohistidine phosphatase
MIWYIFDKTLMKKLYLLRHAEAAIATTMIDDNQRPLTQRGEAQVQSLVHNLAGVRITPELLLYSNALRTTQTMRLFLQHMKISPQCVSDNKLYLCEAEQLWNLIYSTDDNVQTLMIVAHNPSLQDFLLQILVGDNYEKIMLYGFPTCGFAMFEAENITSWVDLRKRNISNTRLVF